MAPPGVPPEGRYSNRFKIGYNAFEVLLDFGQVYQEGAIEHFHTRIVLTPAHAKLLLASLEEAMGDYEQRFGGAGGESRG